MIHDTVTVYQKKHPAGLVGLFQDLLEIEWQHLSGRWLAKKRAQEFEVWRTG